MSTHTGRSSQKWCGVETIAKRDRKPQIFSFDQAACLIKEFDSWDRLGFSLKLLRFEDMEELSDVRAPHSFFHEEVVRFLSDWYEIQFHFGSDRRQADSHIRSS
jgi:hypothetical protein